MWGIVLVLVLVVAMGLFFKDTYAAWITDINTTDGLLDPNWGTPLFTATSPITDDDLDIKNAWMHNNGEYIYFRIETWKEPAVPSGFDAVALLDCNSNGVYTDNDDRKIVYRPNTPEFIYILYGDQVQGETPYWVQCTSNSTCTWGERVGTTANIEWKVQYTQDTDWPAECLNDIKIGWATANETNWSTYMITPFFGYDIPTAIKLENLEARSGDRLTLPVLALIGILFGIGYGFYRISRNADKKLNN